MQIRAKMPGRKDKIRPEFDSEMREQDAYSDNPLANNPLANQDYRATADDFEVDTQKDTTDNSSPSQKTYHRQQLAIAENALQRTLSREELHGDVKLPADMETIGEVVV